MKLLSVRYLSTFFLADKVFRQVIGVEKSIFQYLLSVLSEAYYPNHSGRGRKPKFSLSDILFMTLKYWRQYATQLELAVEFMVGETTVHDWIVWVENHLIQDENLFLEGNQSLEKSDILRLCLVDVTESLLFRKEKISYAQNSNCF